MNPFEAQLAEIEREHREKAEALGITLDELYDHNAQLWAAEERRRERQRFVDAYRDSVSLEVLETVLDGLGNSDPLTIARRWSDTEKSMLVLCGRPSTGKTVAAVSLLRRFGGEVIRAGDLAERVKLWGEERKLGIRELNLEASFLVLDDLGAEIKSTRFEDALFRFVDARLRGVRTVITTNLGKDEIRPKYGDRIADRLNHVSLVFECSGPSLRRKGAGL